MIIWLQGPSGAGKTTVGRELARLRNVPFVDLDEEIVRGAGKSILDIFWSEGEKGFRAMEWNALLELMERDRAPKVIALGGGAVIDPAVRSMMRASGVRLFLDVDPDVAIARLESDEPRPLLYEEDPAAAWRRLYNQRLKYYEDADVTMKSDGEPESIAGRLNEALTALAGPLWSRASTLDGERSNILCFRSLHVLMEHLRSITSGRRVCFVADRSIVQYYGDYIQPEDESRGDIVVMTVEPGEERKSLETVEELVGALAESGFTRDDLIVGIGGGVVTDLAGFLASIYMRGIRAIYIPTTLLAQVDAAIGGKTAVNAAGARNLLGTIRQPSDVLIGIPFLRSLPHRELRSGFVESLKMGIGNSAPLADAVEQAIPAIVEGRLPENIEEVIRLSVEAKLDVVEQDTRDTSVRMSLNLGHTFGHALEAAAPGVYAHGEAVAFGLIAAAEMARSLGRISDPRASWIIERALPFTHRTGRPHNLSVILHAMQADKKRAAGGLRFILPMEETGVDICVIDDDAAVMEAMERAFEKYER